MFPVAHTPASSIFLSILAQIVVVHIYAKFDDIRPASARDIANDVLASGRPTLGNSIATREELDMYTGQLFELLEKGAIKLRVHKEYEFSAEGIKQSQVDITGRGTTGKLLIKIA